MGEYADDLIEAGMRGDNPFGFLKDFNEWYHSHKWNGCSKYEIAGMAWHEVAEHYGHEETDDEFTWWFDEFSPNDILTDYGMALMAWNKAKKKYKSS